MPDLKLTYFDFPGRAEAARLALAIGDLAFEDERVLPQEFLSLRATLPYASLPILTVDGAVFAQSAAILRYCGVLAGLYPADPLAAQRIDEVVDTVLDFIDGLEKLARAADDDDDDEDDDDADTMRQMKLLKYVNEAVPRFLGGLDKRLAAFGKGPWAVGEEITIADLAIYVCLLNIAAGAFDHMTMRPIQAYKRINMSFDAVKAHPKVVAWNDEIARRAEEIRKIAEGDDDRED